MKINRLSQGKFKSLMKEKSISDENVFKTNAFYICLNSTDWIHSIPYFKKDHHNVINLYFDDVEVSGPKEIPWFNNETKIINAIAMDDEQSNKLARFISTIPVDSTVYIYCAKGKSRSRAVEDFINSVITGKDEISLGSNKHVYYSLRNSYAKL
jgi:hypothetical protein